MWEQITRAAVPVVPNAVCDARPEGSSAGQPCLLVPLAEIVELSVAVVPSLPQPHQLAETHTNDSMVNVTHTHTHITCCPPLPLPPIDRRPRIPLPLIAPPTPRPLETPPTRPLPRPLPPPPLPPRCRCFLSKAMMSSEGTREFEMVGGSAFPRLSPSDMSTLLAIAEG